MSNTIFSFFGEVGLKTMEAEKGLKDITNKAQGTADKMKSGFSGISTGINKSISGIASGMSSTLSSVGKMASSAGASLTKYITKPALAAGTALAGIALKKGWDRLIGIDTARAKLQGLGHDAGTVDTIMENALEAVRGTAFGMAEAATTAASAVAAGIEPGKELTGYLKLVGDAAAIAGTGMDEMGSIFNKVTTSGIAQTDELQQIADRGIPIWSLLSETLGISQEEVKKWASEGKISAEIFQEAMEKGVGGAAAIIGANSFSAALANIGASIGRIGANFLDAGGEAGGFFSQVKPLLAELNEWLGTVEDQAAKLGVKLGKVFKGFLKQIKEWKKQWDSLGKETQGSIKKMAGSVAALAVVIGPVLKVIGTIAKTGGKATKAVNAIGGSLTKLGLAASKAGGGLSAFSGVFSGLGALANIGAIGLGAGAFGGILATLGLVQKQFGDQLDGMFTMAQEKGPEVIRGLVQGITSELPELISLGSTLLTNFLDTITANLPDLMVGGAEILGSLISGFSENIPDLMGSAIEFLFAAIKGLIKSLPGLIAAGGDLIQGLVDGFVENWPLLKEEIENLGPVIREAVEDIIEDLKVKYEELKEKVQELIDKYKEWGEEHPILSSFIEGLALSLGILAGAFIIAKSAIWLATAATAIFGGVMAFVTSPITLTVLAITALITIAYMLWKNWDEIAPMLAQVWEDVKTWVTEKVEEMVTAVTEWFSDMWEDVTTYVDNLVTDIKTGFSEAWETIKEKVKGMYESVKEWFGKIPGKIKELWGNAQSFLEGIKLGDIGRNIVQGLWDGIAGKWDSMVKWISEKAANVTETLKGVFQINSPAKVMIPIGSALPEGVAVGVEKGAKFVDKALNKLGSEVANTSFDVPEVAMTSNYAFKQQPTQAQQNSNNLLEEAVYLLRKIFDKDTDININGRTLSEEILDDINYLNDLYNNRDTRIRGGVAYP